MISSIHQPSSQIFELFDDLMLLDEGCIAYYGPRADAVGYFAGLGFQCPQNWNPADYFLDLVVLEDQQPQNLSVTYMVIPTRVPVRAHLLPVLFCSPRTTLPV